MSAFFITGTGTGIGKTYFTAWLVRQWRRLGYDAAGLKPISTGDRTDAETLAAASDLPLAEVNRLHFILPAAPLISAQAEEQEIDLPQLNAWIVTQQTRFAYLAVEGVGGWRVPLTRQEEVRDWARQLGWPVVVVAHAGLGTLNHSLLTIEAILAGGQTCAGLVLNHGPEPPDEALARSNERYLQERLRLPVFYFDRAAERAGVIPVWLRGKEI